MKLNLVEKLLVNNPARALVQRVPGELVWGVDLTGNRAAKVD